MKDMKRTLGLILTLAMLLTFASFPAFAETAATGTPYYANGTLQRDIYLKQNVDGTMYEIDWEKSGLEENSELYEGDRLILQGILSQYPAYDDDPQFYMLRRSTTESSANAFAWDRPGDVIYLTEGTNSIHLTSYYKTDGEKYQYEKDPDKIPAPVIFTLEGVTAREGDNPSLTYIPFSATNTTFHGRRNTSKPFELLWHGSGVEFKFTGTKIAVKITSTTDQTIVGAVDGEEYCFYTHAGTYTYTIAENLENKEHTVSILRGMETFVTAPTLVAAATDATTISPVDERELKIQFLGDSISSGAAMPNYTQSYTYLTSKALNADMQVHSMSGAVMFNYMDNNGNRNNGFVHAYMFDAISWYRKKGHWTLDEGGDNTLETFVANDAEGTVIYPSGDYDHSLFTPDVIVINLGENDKTFLSTTWTANKLEYNKTGFVKTYVSFLKELQTLYPNTKFVCCFGMMSKDTEDDVAIDAEMMNLIEQAVATFNADTNSNNAFAYRFKKGRIDDALPTNAHPALRLTQWLHRNSRHLSKPTSPTQM